MLSPQDAVAGVVVAVLATGVGRGLLQIRPREGLVGSLAISYIFCALGTLLVPLQVLELFGARVIPCLLLVWLPWYLWYRQSFREEAFPFISRGTPIVHLWLDADQIRVYPQIVKVKRSQKLAWYIDAKDKNGVKDNVTIAFTSGSSEDPFESGGGRYHHEGPGKIQTGNAKELPSNKDEELWHYTVTWTRNGDTKTTDPGVWRKDD